MCKVLTVPAITASFGIIASYVPALNLHICTTHGSNGDTFLGMRFKRLYASTAGSIGSILLDGNEPCPPFPINFISKKSGYELTGPGSIEAVPIFSLGSTCIPIT